MADTDTIPRGRAAALLAAAAFAGVYALRMDDVVGMMTDDAWYVLLARALSREDGYWLVNAPVERILPGYPPGFPAILAVVFAVAPSFPDNLWLLKLVSVAAMAAAGWFTYIYLHRQRHLESDVALCAAAGMTLTPSFVFLATSTVMSECVFLLLQLLAVMCAHEAAGEGERHGGRFAMLAGVLAAAAMLVRSAGIAIVAAVLLVLVKDRRWKPAAQFAAVVAVCMLPWLVYSRINAPSAGQQEIHRGSIVYNYGEQFWMQRAGSAMSGRITAADLPQRVGGNIVDVVTRGIGGVFAPALVRGVDESGEEVVSLGANVGWAFVGLGGLPANMAISLVLTLVMVWGFARTVRTGATAAEFLVPITIAITVLWPWWPFRFILPLTPFFFLYLVRGLQAFADRRVARMALLTIIGLHLYDHAGYIARHRMEGRAAIDWLARYDEVDRTAEWLAGHVATSHVIATTNPALIHLKTGHPTIALDVLVEPWAVWRRRGADFVACLIPTALPDQTLGSYVLLFESSPDVSKRAWVLDIRPSPVH